MGPNPNINPASAPTVAYTAPRDLNPDSLKAGDQIRVLPTAPDADIPWVPMWGRSAVEREDARWMTVAEVLRTNATNNTVVRLEDGTVLDVVAHFDKLLVRMPCAVTP